MTEADPPRPRPSAGRAPQIPDGGIAVALPVAQSSGSPVPGRNRGRRRRAMRRLLRTRRGRWTLVVVVAVLVIVVGLLSRGFVSSPAAPLADAPPSGSGGLTSVAPTAVATSPGARAGRPASAEEIRKELQARAATLNNPLNALRSPGVHNVTIGVRSAGSVNSVGYLIPTSINTNYAYGTKKVTASSFGFSTKAVGPGYLALIFVQAGATGTPVTCTVTIDGKTTSRVSTQGPYARQVCLG